MAALSVVAVLVGAVAVAMGIAGTGGAEAAAAHALVAGSLSLIGKRALLVDGLALVAGRSSLPGAAPFLTTGFLLAEGMWIGLAMMMRLRTGNWAEGCGVRRDAVRLKMKGAGYALEVWKSA
jgi:hypothetical protein